MFQDALRLFFESASVVVRSRFVPASVLLRLLFGYPSLILRSYKQPRNKRRTTEETANLLRSRYEAIPKQNRNRIEQPFICFRYKILEKGAENW
jgi:hypothetical protein